MEKQVNDMNGISQNRKHKFKAQLGTTIHLPGKSLVRMLWSYSDGKGHPLAQPLWNSLTLPSKTEGELLFLFINFTPILEGSDFQTFILTI